MRQVRPDSNRPSILLTAGVFWAVPAERPFFLPNLTLTMARPFPYLRRVTSQKDTHSVNKDSISFHYEPEFPLDSAVSIVSVDEAGLMEMLLKLRSSERFITDLAEKLGVSPQHLGNVLAGRATFGPKLLKGLGVVRTYQMYDVEIVMDEQDAYEK